MCGIRETCRTQPKSRYTELSVILPMAVKQGQLINSIKRSYTTFTQTCLRKILCITWQKHIPDTKVLTQASLPSIYTILMQSQLRWAGHVVHIKDHCLLKKLLYGELFQGKCIQGQKKHFKDTLKVSMKSIIITLIAWNIWRSTDRSDVKLPNVGRKPVKQEGMLQLSCAGNLEKTLPHQPLLPSFLVLTA